MKILQLTTHFSPNVGGVETHLDDLVSSLLRRNHKVDVLTYRPLVTKTKWRMNEKDKNLSITRLPWFPGFFYNLVDKPVLEFLYLVPGLFIATPFYLIWKKPEVVHTHGLIAGFVGVFWGFFFRTRVVTTTHSIYHFPESGMYTSFARWIFENSDKLLTLSKQSKKEIEDLGVKKSKIQTFTYWVDLNIFKPKKVDSKLKKKLSSKGKFIVLFVGRLIKEKGILELLDAAKKWNEEIILLIIGTGPLEKEIDSRKSTLKNLVYLGKVNNSRMPMYYNAADIVIVPSVHEEGFGRVILESLACGTPVVGSKRGAIPEAMNNKVGRLIEITPQSIQNTVEDLYKNKKDLKEVSKEARAFAKERYSEENVEKIVKSYKE